MIKPDALRTVLVAASTQLQTTPDILQMSLADGYIKATLGRGNGWRYQYKLVLELTGFTADPDVLVAPMIAWLRANQPDLFLNQDDLVLIDFSLTPESNGSNDIVIKIPLTESVVVSEADGVVTTTHRTEPQIAGINAEETVASQLLLNGTPVTWPPASADTIADVLWPDS